VATVTGLRGWTQQTSLPLPVRQHLCSSSLPSDAACELLYFRRQLRRRPGKILRRRRRERIWAARLVL